MKKCTCKVLVGLITAGFLVFNACAGNNQNAASLEFTNIRRGTVERTVSSSGTINPVAAVKVLPRMSGKVEAVFVNYNDTVRRGDILAELNTDVLRLERDRQLASVQKARANYELQSINFRNQLALSERNLISDFELLQSRTNLDNLAADLAVAEANLRLIETQINQYAFITSPIDGIVLDRSINVGDTVVDSSTNMFVIAENMRDMQIEANVGELDISSIHRGQEVRFTLESLPGRRFSGVVDNMRMVPVVSSGIVSYMIIINVENLDGSLLPGMTCAVDFIVERSIDALVVPNAALRFQPTSLTADQISEMTFTASLANMTEEQQQAAVETRIQAQAQQASRPAQTQSSAQSAGGLASLFGGGRMSFGGFNQGGGGQGLRTAPVITYRNLWYVGSDGRLDVMQVRTGISDGTSTVIFLDDEFDGVQVVLRERI